MVTSTVPGVRGDVRAASYFEESERARRGVKMKRMCCCCFGPEKKLRWRLVMRDRMA